MPPFTDGQRFITTGADNTARIWDVATSHLAAPPLVHNGTIRTASFSPHGHSVVTASEDHTARVWDATQGEALTPLLRHAGQGKVLHAAYSPDGQHVLTTSEDGTARLWHLHDSKESPEALKKIAFLLSSKRIDDKGRLVPTNADELHKAWEERK